MERKFLDQTGVQRLVEKLSEHMSSGGGSGKRGRLKKHGTAELPVNLDKLIGVNSYTVSGVIDGLPEELKSLLTDFGIDEFELQLDVQANINVPDEDGDIILFTQEIHCFDFSVFKSSHFHRVGILQYGDALFSDWVRVTPSAQVECRFLHIGTLNEVVIPDLGNELRYTLAFQSTDFPNTALIQDVVLLDSWGEGEGDAIYPQMRMSQADSTLQRNGMGRYYTEFNRLSFNNVYILGTAEFENAAAKNAFFSAYGNHDVYVVYNNNYVVEESIRDDYDD